MANTRIVTNDFAKTASAVFASSSASGFPVTNLQSTDKSQVWRSTSKTATLKFTISDTSPVGVVALLFSNLTATATGVVRCYRYAADTTPILTKAATILAPAGSGFVNAYTFTGSTHGVVWFAPTVCQRVEIDISDSANSSTYLEVSEAIVGAYWEAVMSPETESLRVQIVDTTTNSRSEAGQLRSDRGVRYKKLSFSLSGMSDNDRATFWGICAAFGRHTPMFVSVLPETADVFGTQMHDIYGKLTSDSEFIFRAIGLTSVDVSLEEI